MSPSKVKKEISKKRYAEVVTGKLKEFKTWAQVKSPKSLRPALSYALDWLAPELLGTGFRMYEVSDLEIKGTIPADKTNLDSQQEIHQGLVTNAVLEMAKTFIQRQIPESFFQLTGSELSLVKKNKWNSDLNLVLKVGAHELDDFFVLLQKNNKAPIELEIRVAKNDKASLKLHIETINLIG